MSAAALALTTVGNVLDFGGVREILHDSDFVQVRIADASSNITTYARAIRQRSGLDNAWGYAAHVARTVEETASLVSTPALVAWLLDSGFVLVH
jgi:hypothetical protein